MKFQILNSAFDRESGDISVHLHADGECEPAWISLDMLIKNYHGKGRPTKESIRSAIGLWLNTHQEELEERKRERDGVAA